jgi:hypothetical protein
MPRAPSYERQARVQPIRGGTINVRTDPRDFGAGVGAAVSVAAFDVVRQEVDRADEIAFTAASSRLKARANKMLYDPQEGALAKKGKDSFDLPSTVMPEFDQAAGDIAAELTTDRQKLAYSKAVAQVRMDVDLAVQRHVYAERREYDKLETEGLISTARSDAVHNYADPERVMRELQIQTQTIIAHAKRNGVGAEATRVAVEQTRSKTLLDVIERAATDNNDKVAKVYYEEGKSFLKGDDQTKAAKLVEETSLRGESQRVADELLSTEGENSSAQLAKKIKDIKDPKLRDLVQNRIDAELNRREQRQAEEREDLFMGALNMIERGSSFADLSASAVAQLNYNQRAALRSYQKSLAKGQNIETDWELYYRLKTMGTTDATLGEFAKTDLMQYRHKLDDTEFKELVALQGSYRKGAAKDEDKINGFRTIKQVVDDSLAAVGLDPTPKEGKTESKQVAQFRRVVDEQVLNFQSTHGRKPNVVEIQELVDSLLVKAKVPGSGILWDDKKFAFELKGDERLAVKRADIPSADARKIEEALRRNNVPVTDAKVVELYNLRIQGILRNAK